MEPTIPSFDTVTGILQSLTTTTTTTTLSAQQQQQQHRQQQQNRRKQQTFSNNVNDQIDDYCDKLLQLASSSSSSTTTTTTIFPSPPNIVGASKNRHGNNAYHHRSRNQRVTNGKKNSSETTFSTNNPSRQMPPVPGRASASAQHSRQRHYRTNSKTAPTLNTNSTHNEYNNRRRNNNSRNNNNNNSNNSSSRNNNNNRNTKQRTVTKKQQQTNKSQKNIDAHEKEGESPNNEETTTKKVTDTNNLNKNKETKPKQSIPTNAFTLLSLDDDDDDDDSENDNNSDDDDGSNSDFDNKKQDYNDHGFTLLNDINDKMNTKNVKNTTATRSSSSSSIQQHKDTKKKTPFFDNDNSSNTNNQNEKPKRTETAAQKRYKKFAAALSGKGMEEGETPKAAKPNKEVTEKKKKKKTATTTTTTNTDKKLAAKQQQNVMKRPKFLFPPTKPGRTDLGEKVPSIYIPVPLMKQDIVLHYDDGIECMSENTPKVDHLMGVYQFLRVDDKGFMIYLSNKEKTNDLLFRLRKLPDEAYSYLKSIGISINPKNFHPCDFDGQSIIFRSRTYSGYDCWVATNREEWSCSPETRKSAYMVSGYPPRTGDIEFWTDPDSLLRHGSRAFSGWGSFPGERVDVAMTPLSIFHRTIDVAEMPMKLPHHLPYRAADFYFWNVPLIIHPSPNVSPLLRTKIAHLMGVYIPGGDTFDGYPVWHQDNKKSESWAGKVQKYNMNGSASSETKTIILDEVDRKMQFNCMYMYHHALHIAPFSSFHEEPTRGFALRGSCAPAKKEEEQLLIESDALFRLGDQAYFTWIFQTFSAPTWTEELKIAVTPEPFFEKTLELMDLETGCLTDGKTEKSKTLEKSNAQSEITITTTTTAAEHKKNRNKKKKKKKSHDTTNAESESSPEQNILTETSNEEKCNLIDKIALEIPKSEVEISKALNSNELTDEDMAQFHCGWMSKELSLNENLITIPESTKKLQAPKLEESIRFLFGTIKSPAFFSIDESIVCLLFETILRSDCVTEEIKQWLSSQVDVLLLPCIEHSYKSLAVSMLSTGAPVKAKSLMDVFRTLPDNRSDEYNNNITKSISNIVFESKDEVSKLQKMVNKLAGKQTRKDFFPVLKQCEAAAFDVDKSKQSDSVIKQTDTKTENIDTDCSEAIAGDDVERREGISQEESMKLNSMLEEHKLRVSSSLQLYWEMLKQYQNMQNTQPEKVDVCEEEKDITSSEFSIDKDMIGRKLLSSEEADEEMAKCEELPLEEQEIIVSNVEKSMDLFNWDDDSVWTIDITEQAHKWFRKHVKRQYHLCDRVIRRLKLLSIGRWSYALCKRLHTKKSSANLYESKIDSGSRIIWEVAIAFSARRSRASHSYCEQVIRVWDVVQDHDNLSRSIERVIERIEKSRLRGEQCMIYSELDGLNSTSEDTQSRESSAKQVLPRVFAMREGIICQSNNTLPPEPLPELKNGRHYPPASDDPLQFTLLKFYELNSNAIKLLLDGKDENADLPFTPGPKEHEIIHYNSDPPRSLLLMGRSGTGKTTCLVFRMWAQFMAYEDKDTRPRQLFVTKNEVLRNEVQKSFLNMGLAWHRKKTGNDEAYENSKFEATGLSNDSTSKMKFPMFLTSNEWLEILDIELPGEPFFSHRELEERTGCRDQDDAVKRGVEALFAADEEEIMITTLKTKEIVRKEMTFGLFRKKWSKINSRIKSHLDPALVWLEIKSYIKGSVQALKIGYEERLDPQHRFLTRQEYLSLPRKVSRSNALQREEIYDLYEVYEKIKKEGNFYDEMDVVYNLAGRTHLFLCGGMENDESNRHNRLLPIDSLFVDEVQDFTQSELYLLTKLSRDPNNLMLAGDTAQSIAVGVGFRFTDVRQIFYNSFGGIEPTLLQLTHNFRSHAGVLRLAATVVELLYYFFSDSLDRLPPDLGLFTGPKPVIMEAKKPDELVLMLDGSKRETSRIEFGSHQVVIVRNDDAKRSLPDEFGVDKDWVMTVQESKGLEFDDVLLYNFFSDSEAGDMWRVVANYSEKDIASYYEDASVKSSGVQSYDWDDLMERKTRHLEFSQESHKLLETELKMLYTAITRARVNVFIAERDSDLSRPMFEYFTRRRVVEVADLQNREGIAGVRVFGKMSTIDDWRERGEYYLQNAHGQRRKGCLRLAAKCFDKAGEAKKKEHALAYLAFVEIEEQDSAVVRRREKQNAGRRQRLYEIAAQLLEAGDVIFLDKAALCLLQTGEEERVRSAEMFELYARICHSKRMASSQGENAGAPSNQEKQYFSYAGRLFSGTILLKQYSTNERRDMLLRSVKNFLRSGTKADLEQAAGLIETNLPSFQKSFLELSSMCTSLDKFRGDPIEYYQREVHASGVGEVMKKTLDKLARISCRSYYADDNIDGMTAALELIPRAERVRILVSFGADLNACIARTLWASHPAFLETFLVGEDGSRSKPKKIDVTMKLVDALTAEGDYERAARILEERGLLLEAADVFGEMAGRSTNSRIRDQMIGKSTDLKARYVELILRCDGWDKHRERLCGIIESVKSDLAVLPSSSVSQALLMSIAVSSAKVGKISCWDAIEKCSGQCLWRYEGVMLAISSDRIGLDTFLSKDQNTKFWDGAHSLIEVAHQMERTAAALLRSSSNQRSESVNMILQAESYFGVQQDQFDRSRAKTGLVTNLRLREVLRELKGEKETSQISSLRDPTQLSLNVDREKVHIILAKWLFRKSSDLLMTLEHYLKEKSTSTGPCISIKYGLKCKFGMKCKHSHDSLAQATRNHINILGDHLLCLEQMHFIKQNGERSFHNWPLSELLQKREKDSRYSIVTELMKYFTGCSQIRFKIVVDDAIYHGAVDDKNVVHLRRSLLKILAKEAQNRWWNMSAYLKKHPAEVIRGWKMLRFCDENGDAKAKIENSLKRIEKKSAKDDLKKGKDEVYVDATVSSPRDVKLFSRLWIYAVDAADENLFTSLDLVAKIIERGSNFTGLNPMTKIDQIALLEVSAISVFSAFCLRYSDAVKSGPCHFLIPKLSYLECYLVGSGSDHSRGFGIPIKDAISNACHNSANYFEFFEKCVNHLEYLSETMVTNELLRHPKHNNAEDLGRFERAICLGSFISCNAVILSLAGEDMSPQEAREDLNKLPSIPLCGSVCNLVGKLRLAVSGCDFSPRLKSIFQSFPSDPSMADLVGATDQLLRHCGWSDMLLLCWVREQSQNNVEIHSSEDMTVVRHRLSNIPFDESRGIFLKDHRPRSQGFLSEMSRGVGMSIDVQDVSAISKKSEERNAAITIQRAIRLKRNEAQHRTLLAGSYFEGWKKTMCKFIEIVKRKIGDKLSRMEENYPQNHELSNDHENGLGLLSALPNLWANEDLFEAEVQRWNHRFLMYSPFCDGIECTYCGIVHNFQMQQNRMAWCLTNRQQLTYTLAVRDFNNYHFGFSDVPIDYSNPYASHHPFEHHHMHNTDKWENHKNDLARKSAAVEASVAMMQSVLELCDSNYRNYYHQQSHHEAASWYFKIGEEAKQWLGDLDSARYRIMNEGLFWPLQPDIPVLMATIDASCKRPREFFERIVSEERSVVNLDEDEGSEYDVNDTIHPIEDDFVIPV